MKNEDFEIAKRIALSTMETAENLMDECAKRADRIKELETATERMIAGEHAADKEIERLRMKIFDIEGREDLVTTELERRVCVAEDRLHVIKEMRDEVLEDWEAKRYAIAQLESDKKRMYEIITDLTGENKLLESDLGLLDEILTIMNPLIKSGNYAQPMAYYQLLSRKMHELCQTVVQFRRKHNIVG